ncbi:FkbM family methyltransferase [Roseomonas sp. HF4]|uniref:FkbM family methyltransferase n=1 Tax=Roseomonas sp. HF4 TaxID=2562313 RepID=UPI001484CB1C|nr:FkbM family methyltransferase [Roseomonas sp. HF4]
MFNFLTTAGVPLRSRITLVDIGAAGGVQKKWLAHRRSVRPVLFEPNPEEAARLRPLLSPFPDALVVEQGLAAIPGAYTLNVAHWPGCSSLLTPDPAVLAGYGIARLYGAVRQASVECVRFDDLHRAGQVPTPDIIKVDVEGYEHQVLTGFGELLHGVIGIEAEAWLYPVFKGQKLLHDLVELVGGYGLRLRRIEHVEGFEGDLVCVNAYFTRGKARRPELTDLQRQKYALMERVWELELK